MRLPSRLTPWVVAGRWRVLSAEEWVWRRAGMKVRAGGPGRIKAEISVPLQRPRDIDTHAVVDFAAEIRRELQHDEYVKRDSGGGYVI